VRPRRIPLLPLQRHPITLTPADEHIVLAADEKKYMTRIDQRAILNHPAGFPMLIGCAGPDPEGRRVALITSEYPEAVRFRRSKSTAEEHHLDRFVADYRNATGSEPFDSFRRGTDPPDFFVRRGAIETGLDVTQLVLQKRVEAHEGLQAVRSAALIRGSKKFRRLSGHIVQLALSEPRAKWKEMVDKTIDALERLDPSPHGTIWTPTGRRGSKLVEIGSGEGFAAAGPLKASLPGSFYGHMRFDVFDCHAMPIYADEAWKRLQDLVSDHDKPEIGELLVAGSAPVGGGFAFPSDLITATLVLEQVGAGSVLHARHIKTIYLHSWLLRSIDVLQPGIRGATEIADGAEAAAELTQGAVFTPDLESYYDWGATEFTATGLPDVYVRQNVETGERQVFVKTNEIRDGLRVWRRDDTGVGSSITEAS
jgi:hypothetical protein